MSLFHWSNLRESFFVVYVKSVALSFSFLVIFHLTSLVKETVRYYINIY